MELLDAFLKIISGRLVIFSLFASGIVTWYFSTTPAGASVHLFSGIFVFIIAVALLVKYFFKAVLLPVIKKFRERKGGPSINQKI